MQSLILVSRRFEKCRISFSFPDASKHVVIHIRIKTLRKARKSIFHTRFTTLRKCSLSYSFLNASNKRSPSNSFHDTSNNGNIRKQMVWGVLFAVIIVFKCLQSRKTRTHHTLGPENTHYVGSRFRRMDKYEKTVIGTSQFPLTPYSD